VEGIVQALEHSEVHFPRLFELVNHESMGLRRAGRALELALFRVEILAKSDLHLPLRLGLALEMAIYMIY